MSDKIKVLCLGVHEDDCDYSVSGTAALLDEAGCEVKFLCMTSEDKVIPGETKMNDPIPLRHIQRELFVPNHVYYTYYNSESVLELEKKIREYRPNILFVMWPKDNHIEHEYAARMQLDAAFRAGGINEIYAYETGPLQTMTQFGMPDITVNITEIMPEIRKVLLSFFDEGHGDYFVEEKEVSARFRGYCAYKNFEYGEAFRIIKYPEGHDDFLLRKLLGDKFRWGGVGGYFIGNKYYGAGGGF